LVTYSAITKVKDRKRAEGLGIAFEKLNPAPMGVGVFELEDGSSEWEVGAYFDDEPDEVSILILENAFEATGIVISEIPETDWVSKVKRELSPVEAGRFFVFGDHDSEKLPQDRVGLLIEASMAFGTGHHGTTKGCLLALDSLISKNKRLDNVIDIGCGTAVLAMAVGKVSSSKIIASDVDQVAVEVALANLKANKLQNRIDCLEAMGFPQPATPIKTDNAAAQGILNNTMKQKRSKAINVRFYWLRDRAQQGQFFIYWESGDSNWVDYFTKHHPAKHHRVMRPIVTYVDGHSPKSLQGCIELKKRYKPTNRPHTRV
jgi:ribosomal protein L11 methyltransferase